MIFPGLNFISVCENQTEWCFESSVKVGHLCFDLNQICKEMLHLLYDSIREINSRTWMLQESLRELITHFLSQITPCFHDFSYNSNTNQLTHFDPIQEFGRKSISVNNACVWNTI